MNSGTGNRVGGWSIRHGVAADAAALAEFAARTFADAYEGLTRSEDIRAHIAKSFGVDEQTHELTDPEVVTLLAYHRETLAGYAQVRRGAAPACVTVPRPVEMQRFYLDRPARGSGVAPLVMGVVQETARMLGGRHLWLSVWERNPRAIAFYRKMGFTEAGHTEFLVGGDRQRDRVYVTAVAAVPEAAVDGGIYHLSSESGFRANLAGAQFRPANLVEDGFVHCALAGSVIPVANDFFADCVEPVVVLAIDPRRLGDRVRYEAPARIAGGGSKHLAQATLFPHVYGPIEAAAITGVGVLKTSKQGFEWPDRLKPLQTFLAGG